MTKKLLSLAAAALLMTGAAAQSIEFDQSDIQYWVGTGSNSAVVVIGWDNCTSGNDFALAWGVHWNGSVTAVNMLDTIATYDSRVQYNISSGFVTSIGYNDGTLIATPGAGSYWCYGVNGGYADAYSIQPIVDGDLMEISSSCSFTLTSATAATDPNGTTPTDTTSTSTTIGNDDILFWVGHGTDSAIIVINWVDALDNSTTYAWGIAFDDEAGVVVSEALDTLATYDPRFYYHYSRYMGEIFELDMVRFVDDSGDTLATVTAGMSAYNCLKVDGLVVDPGDFEMEWIWPGSLIEISTDCYFSYNTIVPVSVPSTTPTSDPVDATIAFSDILYWVGSGSDSVAFIVNYAQPDTAFAWGFLFNGTTTAQAMIDSIAAADPRFWYTGSPSMSGDVHFITDAGDTLGLSPVGTLGFNFWWTNLNGRSAGAGIGATLHNGDVFKYGDLNSAIGWDPMGTYFMEEAWLTAPTPVAPPAPSDTTSDTTSAPVEATIAASDILYWVGTGSNQAVLAVNWADTALAWGYRFDGSATVADMMDAIAAADPRFSYVGSTGYLSDILYIDTAAGMTDTLRGSSWWGSTNNGVMDAGMGQALTNGDFEKWADPAAGVVVDSTYWEGYGWGYTYVYPMAITPVSVPDTATTTPSDTTSAPIEATIAASDILYWVGHGSNQAVLAVNWADTALAWGYRFDGSATVADMMNAIAAADPRFSYVGSTGFLSDILYIDTAAGMTDTLRGTPGSWWGSTNNGVMDAGMGQALANGDFEKWADPAAGVVVDSTYWEGSGWFYTYVYPMTITPVSVPDTATTPDDPVDPDHGPFCGAAGTEGSTAIAADSDLFVAWATGVSIVRGPVDIANHPDSLASYGEPEDAIGPVSPTDNLRVVSLGDGGTATITFDRPIGNGNGPDFAVFENGFDDHFLELAFVEVSSDGQRFVRFPATSLTQTETQATRLDPTYINNLAGKYRMGYGTPFDLEELRDSTGLDINNITHVRLVDVVGSIDPLYATYDAFGHIVNDPWPTFSYSAGFDLAGIGVIHQGTEGIDEAEPVVSSLWPNPTTDIVNVSLKRAAEATLYDATGRQVAVYSLVEGRNTLSLNGLGNGVYMLRVEGTACKIVKK